MQSSTWIALLQRIPIQFHSGLVILTTPGVEICLQNVLCSEEEYVAVRGRMSGTTDTGRIYFIPYNQIAYLGYQKEIAEEGFADLYGEPPTFQPVRKLEKAAPAAVEGQASALQPAVQKPETKPPGLQPSGSGPRKLPSKAAMLERLKARRVSRESPPAEPQTSS